MGRNGKASDFEATLATIIFPLLAILLAVVAVRATWSLEPVLAVILVITLVGIAWSPK